MEIGQILKEEREAKQLTLDDIQEMTKIQKRYLQAIEDDDFKRLPGRFYARAFIKEYAIVLDIDYEALLGYFDRTNMHEEETVQYANVRRSRRARAPKSSTVLSFFPTIIVIILIIGVLFVAWTLTQKALTTDSNNPTQSNESDEIIRDINQPDKDTSEANDGETDDETTEEDAETEDVTNEFNVIEVGTGKSPQSELEFNYNDETVNLSFNVTGEVYVQIRGASNTIYYDGIFTPNSELEPYDITDEEHVYLNIGNTTGLVVKINDVEMEYPVSPQDSVHQKFMIYLNKIE